MKDCHSHQGCSHGHFHYRSADGSLTLAFGINVLLSLLQVVGGVLSGSLALVADALHNLSDAFSLFLALMAQKIARKSPDSQRTYGYKKVEILSAYTNYVILILLSLWLMVESLTRFIDPQPIVGWTVIWISIIAVIVNLWTVALTYRGAKNSHNVRAAYLHNLGDALSSVGVIVSGVLVVLFQWWWADPMITLFIAVYILLHVMKEIRFAANLLIDGIPAGVKSSDICDAIEKITGVENVHHFHVRPLDENTLAVEAHVVIAATVSIEVARADIKRELIRMFQIKHAFLEIETAHCGHGECGF